MPKMAGNFVKVQHSCSELKVDNKWIAPYCLLLSRILITHLNVEYCHSVNLIQYICKYFHKGGDQECFAIENKSYEVTSFQTCIYIFSNEGVWKIFGLPTHQKRHAVAHLGVHLEDGREYTSMKTTPNNVRRNHQLT